MIKIIDTNIDEMNRTARSELYIKLEGELYIKLYAKLYQILDDEIRDKFCLKINQLIADKNEHYI